MKRKTPPDHCPTCGQEIDPSKDERFRPFCSKRCQMVDLGKWFKEEYSIPASQAPDEPDQTLNENDDE